MRHVQPRLLVVAALVVVGILRGANGTPLSPPVLLPDGSAFTTWDVPLTFSKTYHVNQKHPAATAAELERIAGAYRVAGDGLTLHLRLLDDRDPATATIEVTVRGCILAHESYGLGYATGRAFDTAGAPLDCRGHDRSLFTQSRLVSVS